MGKQEARDVATGISVISAAGVIAPEPITTAAGVGGLLSQGVGFLAMGFWDAFASVSSSTSGGKVAMVQNVSFNSPTGDEPAIQSVRNSIQVAANIIDDSRLLHCSLSRLKGALESENINHISLQRQASECFVNKLECDVSLYSECLENISGQIQNSSFAKIKTDVSKVLELRDKIVNDGKFPEYEKFVFDEIHATENELKNAINEVSLVTGEHLPKTISGGEIFHLFSNALKNVNIRELLPVFMQKENEVC